MTYDCFILVHNRENAFPILVNPKYIHDSKFEDFVFSNTILFFQGIDVTSSFLKNDPNEWFGNSTYIVSKDTVYRLY